MSLTKNVFKPLAKSVLIPWGLTAEASAADPAIQKKSFGSGMATLIFSSEVTNIIKIVKSLEEFGLLIKEVSEKCENEAKGQKGGCLIILIGTLGASSLGYWLTCKNRIRADEGTISAGQGC